MLLGLVLRHAGEVERARRADAAGRASGCCRRSARWSRGRRRTRTCRAARNLGVFDAMGPDGDRATRAARVAEALERVGLAGVDERPVAAYSLGHAAAARPGRRPAASGRGCWCSTSRPTASTRRASARSASCCSTSTPAGTTVFLSSHLLAEIEQLCTRVGVLDRGRLVLQDELEELQRRPGRVEVRTPDVEQVRALLDGVVEEYDGQRLLVREPDPAALNARLVAAGVRVTSSRRAAHPRGRRAGGDLGGRRPVRGGADSEGPSDPGRAAQAGPSAAGPGPPFALIDALPTLVAVLLAVTDLGPRPGTGPAFLSAVLTDGTLFPLAALGIVLPLFLPIAVAITAGEAIAGEAQQGTLRYLLVRPVGRTRLLVAKLVSGDGVRRADRAGRRGHGVRPRRAAPRQRDVHGHRHRQRLRHLDVDPPSWSAAPSWRSATRCSACSASRPSRCSCPLSTDVPARRGARHDGVADRLDPAAHPRRRGRRCSPTCPRATGWRSSTCSVTRSCGATSLRGVLLQAVYVVVFLGAGWANFMTKDVTD